jgi:phosphate/sulfate permease
MELYLVIVIVLFILAISDLMVGVSNDAVNFLNSAIGSKVAPRHIIMIVASIGILVGTTFSSGLMEVARKGIFNPELFTFPDIMTVFLAVMLTDVLLLDLYNTFGLPTSTTVSIVFELLGSAVAIAAIKVFQADGTPADLIAYINTSKALAIISGILLSIVIAFTVGAIIQYISRLIFTFDFEKRIKRYGAIFAGAALTGITYFILVKGAKGSSFLTPDVVDWVLDNTLLIIGVSLAFWGIIFQLLIWFSKINILKPVVLAGTFALALAFAANDLVNFIGVPLAGLSSYNIGSGSSDPLSITMEALRSPVQSNTILLLIAGIIMVITLWVSKKARSVTKTEVNLGRQTEGFERFESSLLSRSLVRMMVSSLGIVKKITPITVQQKVNKRFNNVNESAAQVTKNSDRPAFDLIRASVNLIVASILISFATSLKLPLSTTYVTFMVAMGTSLSDRAWGRESAVYRVNGVLTVIGGWFFTAFMAFTVAGLFATLIYFFELPIIIVLIGLAAFFIYRTHILHKRRSKEEDEREESEDKVESSGLEAMHGCMDSTREYLLEVSETIDGIYSGLFLEDRDKLRLYKKNAKKVGKRSNKIVASVFKTVKLLDSDQIKKEHRYGKIITSIQEISANLKSLAQKSYEHIDNNHSKPSDEQIAELNSIAEIIKNQIAETVKVLESKNFSDLENMTKVVEEFKTLIQSSDENQIIRIKSAKNSNRLSMLYLSLLADTENISDHLGKLITVCKKNYESINKPEQQ